MQLTCPHCQAAWEFADRRPSFCPFCGKSLPPDAPTEPFAASVPPDSEAATLAPTPPCIGGDGFDPDVIGGYRLLRVLGVGGMGKVYEAEDVNTGRRVAVKLVAADYARSPDAVERFRQEGRLASLIAHPRCVFVLAADEEAGRPYIVMERMPGDTLDDHIRHWGALPPAKAIALILDVIEGLWEAHRVGVIHRDVKPSNCFFGADGRLKVGDFGLSKSLAQGAHLTKTGSFLGTPLYASPEQVRGETVDAQTDVYSVAATLYYLLTGQAPFQSDNAAVALARIAADPPPSMRTLNPQLSAALDAVVLRGLERDRKRRWRNLDEFAEALRPFLRGRLSLASLGGRFGVLAVRFCALVLDLTLVWLLAIPLGLLVTALGWDKSVSNEWPGFDPPVVLGGLALWLLYFGLSEGFFGCSPAKWLFGLRVRNPATGERAAWGWVLARTASFVVLVKLGTLVSAFVLLPLFLAPRPPGQQTLGTEQYGLLFTMPWAGSVVGFYVLACTMRRRNGYRGLHEIISDTAVVPRPRASAPWAGTVTPASQALSRPHGVPEMIGAFDVRGAFRWDDGARILLGFDPALGRQVVLWLRHRNEAPLSVARREVNRTTRLRWLAAGPFGAFQWDGFVAPGGCPLPALIEANGRMRWRQIQPLLTKLTDELLLALKEKTLPAHAEPRLVWVRPDGQIILVDMPLTRQVETTPASAAASPPLRKQYAEDQALDLLARVALLSLEGRPPPEELPPSVRAPLPLPARAALGELLDFARKELPLRAFQRRLATLQDKPPEVTRAHRAGQLGLQAALLLVALGGFIPFLPAERVNDENGETQKAVALAEERIDDLDRASLSDFLCAGLNAHPLARLHGVAQLEEDARLRQELQKAIDRTTEKNVQRMRHAFVSHLLYPQLGNAPELRQAERRKLQNQRYPFGNAAGYRANARSALERVRNQRTSSEGDAEMYEVLCTLAGPSLWVVWAFILPGGFSYLLTGIALVRGDGRPARRLQSAGRALLVWGPLCALLVLSGLLADWYWSLWGTDAAPGWALSLSTVLWWSVWLLLLVYVVLALRSPARSPLDRLAGTYVVPR